MMLNSLTNAFVQYALCRINWRFYETSEYSKLNFRYPELYSKVNRVANVPLASKVYLNEFPNIGEFTINVRIAELMKALGNPLHDNHTFCLTGSSFEEMTNVDIAHLKSEAFDFVLDAQLPHSYEHHDHQFEVISLLIAENAKSLDRDVFAKQLALITILDTLTLFGNIDNESGLRYLVGDYINYHDDVKDIAMQLANPIIVKLPFDIKGALEAEYSNVANLIDCVSFDAKNHNRVVLAARQLFNELKAVI